MLGSCQKIGSFTWLDNILTMMTTGQTLPENRESSRSIYLYPIFEYSYSMVFTMRSILAD